MFLNWPTPSLRGTPPQPRGEPPSWAGRPCRHPGPTTQWAFTRPATGRGEDSRGQTSPEHGAHTGTWCRWDKWSIDAQRPGIPSTDGEGHEGHRTAGTGLGTPHLTPPSTPPQGVCPSNTHSLTGACLPAVTGKPWCSSPGIAPALLASLPAGHCPSPFPRGRSRVRVLGGPHACATSPCLEPQTSSSGVAVIGREHSGLDAPNETSRSRQRTDGHQPQQLLSLKLPNSPCDKAAPCHVRGAHASAAHTRVGARQGVACVSRTRKPLSKPFCQVP